LTNTNIDMAAVARVSGRVDLQAIRLTEVSLNAPKLAQPGTTLEPEFSQECVPLPSEAGFIEVSCAYDFKVHSVGELIAEIKAKYIIRYKLKGEEIPKKDDIEQFASANGSYHSWPFLRELLFGLTARIGYPPFTLPVLSFASSAPKSNISKSESPITEKAPQ